MQHTNYPIGFLADDRLDRIDVPSLHDRLSDANVTGFGLPDDPHAECENCPRCADPEYSPDELAEMERTFRQRMEDEAREVF